MTDSEYEDLRSTVDAWSAAERALLAGFFDEIELPFRDEQLDSLAPRDFFHTIEASLHDADVALILLRPNDWSGPVEGALASVIGRPQVIVTAHPSSVPRLIAGLPGVRAVLASDDLHAIEDALRTFL